MPTLQEFWQGGCRGLHIEECISNAFADFAPYAGADQQRIVVGRQTPGPGRPIGRRGGLSTNSSDAVADEGAAAAYAALGTPSGPASHATSSASVTMEDNGDFSIHMRDPHAGAMTFATTGQLRVEAAARLDLPVALPRAPTRPPHAASNAAAGTGLVRVENAGAPADAPTPAVIPEVAKPRASQRRFSDYTRPLVLLPGASHSAAGPPWGQLEVDMAFPSWAANRQSVGLRAGPAALRVSRVAAPAAVTTSPGNSASLSEDDLLASGNTERAAPYQYTLDAAVCIPIGGTRPIAAARPSGAGADGGASGGGGVGGGPAAEALVTRTMEGDPITLLPSGPWALTCGLQFPFTVGDTLVGVSVQNDRATSVTLPHPGVTWAVTQPSAAADGTAAAPSTSTTDSPAACVACVPSLLYPGAAAPGAPAYVKCPAVSVRLLLVQTVASHTLVRQRDVSSLSGSMLDNSTNGKSANSSRVAASYDWRQLPTLMGVNIGVARDRLRLSAASIMHNGEVDLEGAAVLDTTPWTPRMPTLLKLGYNNAGRLAAGITSLFYETVTATLGVHMARGEQAKFGIEVHF